MFFFKRILVFAGISLGVVGLTAGVAHAHTGSVKVTQDCHTWQAVVELNHNVTADRAVYVTSTIPGTTGLNNQHYNTSYGEIWGWVGTAVQHGTVTLYIFKPQGNDWVLEYKEAKSLPTPSGCEQETTTSTTTIPATTTSSPTTSTTLTVPPTTVTSAPSTTSSSVSTSTTSTSVKLGIVKPIRCQEDNPCWDCATMGMKDCGDSLLPDEANKDARGVELAYTGNDWLPIVAGLGSMILGCGLWAVSGKREIR